MQNDNEKKRLIESTAESYGSANSFAKPARTPPSRWRFFATLTLVIFIFRGSEEMAGVTLKQYVYAWSKNQTAEDNDVTGNTSSNNDGNGTCGVAHESDAQKLASNWELYLNLLLYALLFFSISFAGTMSDYFGRKRFMCLAILGYCVKCVVISIVIYFDLHIAWIFMANGIDGICGSSYCISMVTYSSVADATTGPRERVIAISVSVTILGLSMMSTQFGTGYFIADYGFFYPMVTAASGCMLAFMLAIIFHTEMRNPSHATKHKTAPSLMTLAKNYVSFYAFDGTGAERLIFVLNITIFFMAEMASQATSNPRTLLQLGHPFCWSSEQLGLYNTVYLGGILTVGCLVLVVLQRCLSDPAISCVGLLSGAAYMVVTGMAPDTLWAFLVLGYVCFMLAAVAFGVASVLPKSILRGIASSRASPELQGSLLAGMESSEMLCAVLGGPAALALYSATLDTMRGLVFLVLGGVYVLAFLLMVVLSVLLKRHSKETNIIVIHVNAPEETS